ncbi:M1 family metallopeptidase [Govanella unica]|uniref:M1 family metallopeptidase n=1 Tax=Govanella unica TaxID=2975056 RepID=A0A9X3U1F3_9PROT|nr:M1 family metallopeptidase [Govania unica]MDA5194814.1 M1 family metallopeptidase [Govania unica]
MKTISAAMAIVLAVTSFAAAERKPAEPPHKIEFEDKFRALDDLLPTPGTTRSASGAPGPAYWQQQADYKIRVTLDESKRSISGAETITYRNNSPDILHYLWVQLDQNDLKPHADQVLAAPGYGDRFTFAALRAAIAETRFPGGFDIKAVRGDGNAALKTQIHNSMMRVDLAQPLKPGGVVSLSIDWSYNIPEQNVMGGRAGFEFFPADGNDIFEIGQWFPRIAAYTDQGGWNVKPFLGTGEFSLEFGNYEVAITVPADHMVAATGTLQNPEAVLTAEQRARLQSARTAPEPVFIVTPDEAEKAEKNRSARRATWIFRADMVRDFAFASSRKFAWDAWGVAVPGGGATLAMSFYPREAMPLWTQYSTAAVAHAIEQYSAYLFPYPYPVAQSVNGPVGGMEYPMLSFIGSRPETAADGSTTYAKATKYELISNIVHEVGHNYFPMIINSDERQWAWMDEGLNSFVQYVAEQAWEENYPSLRGEPRQIAAPALNPYQTPVMTRADSLRRLGGEAYNKPAAALTILRETILGRDLFDQAFREYAHRWAFKRPLPADFFRSMEDASGVDLDWFWRGWFYSTDYVDIAIDSVRRLRIDDKSVVNDKAPEKSRDAKKDTPAPLPPSITEQRNSTLARRVDRYPGLKDFYNGPDGEAEARDDDTPATLDEADQALLRSSGDYFYMLEFSNLGGLVMPIILDIAHSDGSREIIRLPAELWRQNPKKVSKLLILKKEITSVTLDPYLETADSDTSNNIWPRKPEDRIGEYRLELVKPFVPRNLMRERGVTAGAPAK